MSEKSFVSQAMAVCPVCTKEHATGVLINQRLRNTLEPKTVTGWEMCPEHQKMKDEGYIALVGIDHAKSDADLTLSGVWRIGMFAHLMELVWSQIFTVPPPPNKLCFVDKDTLEHLRELVWSQIFTAPPPPKKLCFVDKDTLELLEKIPQEGSAG